jgi:hypothetical protein
MFHISETKRGHRSAGYNMPAVVMDNGTGYTKMGFAGNTEPQFIIPTAIACREDPNIQSKSTGLKPPSSMGTIRGEGSLGASSGKGGGRSGIGPLADLDFTIGDEALAMNPQVYSVNYPIRHGLIDNWDLMERFWERCIFRDLKCEPEDHFFLLVSHDSIEGKAAYIRFYIFNDDISNRQSRLLIHLKIENIQQKLCLKALMYLGYILQYKPSWRLPHRGHREK